MERRTGVTASADSRIFGLYGDFASLRAGVDNLKTLRFCNSDISVLFPESAVSKGFVGARNQRLAPTADCAAFIGGTLGWLTYVRPERVGIVAAALVNVGVTQVDAELYEDMLRGGRLLVCVRSSAKMTAAVMHAIAIAGAERVIAVRASTRRNKGNGIERRDGPFDGQVSSAALVS